VARTGKQNIICGRDEMAWNENIQMGVDAILRIRLRRTGGKASRFGVKVGPRVEVKMK